MKNYTKIESKYIEEIQSNVTIYSHNKTKARICTMENEDNNKVFSIAFRTPPIDDSGLTHILEHSVLCGSKKYPVKDPFVELLKSSLNTFLNAFTFPDKTMYPCASQNDTDFKNLMSVYMDAVFYPQIYKHEEIFMQEGWHYHITDKDSPITYNGVVYNEMKGAFSDPEQILFRKLMHSLYPNTQYGLESGGDPKYITDLTYDKFLKFHQEYYHPSNSYILIYGNCDMEERLTWLDENYLNDFEYNDFDTTVKNEVAFDKPVYEEGYYKVDKSEDLDNKTFLSYNLALPTTLDTKLILAISLLISALFQNPGAPVKQALIDAGLGQDVQAILEDGILQPFLALVVYNSNKDKEDEFINLVNTKLLEIANNGLDKESLLSIISFAEFKARERGFSSRMPQGLEIQMSCLSSWLYDDSKPFEKLEIVKYYAELKEALNTNYFENIIKDYFINNNHKSYVKLIPSHTHGADEENALAKKLEDYKNSLGEEELNSLIKKNNDLLEYQSTPSSKEEIDTLPKLRIEDINQEPAKYNLEVLDNGYKVLYSNYHTNDIAYVKYYFDVTGISTEDINYLALYVDLFTQISTAKTNYKDIAQFILKYTGGLGANLTPYNTADRACKLIFSLGYSSLSENVSKASDMVKEIIKEANFNDEKRLYERLCEIKISKEMGISNRGHVAALLRAASYTDENSFISDNISGVAYIDFISDIVKEFENKKSYVIDKISNLVNRLFAKSNFILGFTGSKEQLESLSNVFDDFYNTLADNSSYDKSNYNLKQRNEGLKAQYDVNYVSRVGKYSQEFDGSMLVLNNALSLDYLWTKVRVNGGAYGCMLQIRPSGLIGFTSYRDPNILSTNKVYEEVVDYIFNFNPTDEELLKYKIGAIGNLDTVMHVAEMGATAQRQYFMESSYETRKKRRLELINTTNEDIKKLKPAFEEALGENNICVIGNSNKIEENNSLFKELRNLVK